MFWWCSTAVASSVAGLAVPGVGGGFAGPAEHGALGVLHAPTAAVMGDRPEIALDLGYLHNQLTIRLDGLEEPYADTDRSPQPTLMAAVPFGPVGIGLGLQVPFLRGSEEDADTPLRLYTITSTIQFIEADLEVAVRPHPWFAVGAGLRVGRFTYEGSHAIDTGAMLNAALDPEPALPIGEPLLQGTQAIAPASVVAFSWVVGATLTVPDGPELVAAFRPPWVTRATHGLQFVPSDDLAASIDGQVEVRLAMPAQLDLAARLPIGRVTVIPELQWVGWGRTGRLGASVTDLQLSASDPVLNGLLGAAGLAEADFVTSQEGDRTSDLGWHDVVNLGLQTAFAASETVEVRAGVWRAPSAVRSAAVHPGNVDFGRWDLRGGAAWQPVPALRLMASVDWMPGSTRTIRDSMYTLEDPPAGVDALPSANGQYALRLWRAGLTVVLSLPSGHGGDS